MLDILSASMVVAASSLSARTVVWLPQQCLRRALPWLQASAAGLLLDDALLHMLPEALSHNVPGARVGGLLALGVLMLFALECCMRASKAASAHAPFARVDIVGDAIHHLIDGVVIGASFGINRELGWVIALAILAHELPRELGNAGTLVAGGYSPRRAFTLSILITLAVPFGSVAFSWVDYPQLLGAGLAVATGATVYLACGDLIPNLWSMLDEGGRRPLLAPSAGVVGGLAFMWLIAAIGVAH
ncbi:MAG TPA: ZIP family metal transporter [Rhodanobacteraceae bacterium]|nr:ZIP family metal transporter [Rhodanobacteraceae bacterium]